jgi:hypothetical protein
MISHLRLITAPVALLVALATINDLTESLKHPDTYAALARCREI